MRLKRLTPVWLGFAASLAILISKPTYSREVGYPTQNPRAGSGESVSDREILSSEAGLIGEQYRRFMMESLATNKEHNESPSNEGQASSEKPAVPVDVLGTGYNDWFEEKLGRDPADIEIRHGLGTDHNEFFTSKFEEYSPNYKGPRTIYSGRNPGYLSNGFRTFRTVGPGTTWGYTIGYYTSKGLLQITIGRIKSKPLKTALKKAEDFLEPAFDASGEVGSFYGNIWDNRDVMSHNVRRTFEIIEDPNTYRVPFSPWPGFR